MITKRESIIIGLKSGLVTAVIFIIVTIIFLQQKIFPGMKTEYIGIELDALFNYLLVYMIIATILVNTFIGITTGAFIGLTSAQLMTKKKHSIKKSITCASLITLLIITLYECAKYTIIVFTGKEIELSSTSVLTETAIITMFIVIETMIYYQLYKKSGNSII